LITSLAGPYIPEKVIQRLGSGAEVLSWSIVAEVWTTLFHQETKQ
jgi:hypothetical protein